MARKKTATEFGMMDASGKVTVTHTIDLAKVKSDDPLAYAYGFSQAQRGEHFEKRKDLAPEYIRGFREGQKKRKMSMVS